MNRFTHGLTRALPRALVLAVVAVACLAAPRPASAQDWDPPYCGGQPRISAIFDHEFPDYGLNGILRLYSGIDVINCQAYDGHSGWDYPRSGGRQGCIRGNVPGVPMDLVYASSDGTVYRSRWNRRAHDGSGSTYGLYIDLNHGGAGSMRSLYGHLAAVFVEEGQSVVAGQLIGAVGSTGNSTGPHLHFHGAKGSDATVSRDTFDVYGWCDDYKSPNCPYPGFPDPHRGNGWSQRVIYPGESGPQCPGGCGSWIVDDSDPSVTYRCRAGSTCPYWRFDPTGWQNGHHWTYANGPNRDYYVEYRCPQCGSGTFLVEAYVPYGRNIANTHIARYQIGDRVTIVDQHEEGNVWHPLGIFKFGGVPKVKLNDRTDRYNYTAPYWQKVGADALRFTKICCCEPEGVPYMPADTQS